ncbi:MAG: 30S ribosomal protein S9 [Candidatus Glassbacteria bacterium]
MSDKYIHAVGSRKTAGARVYMKPGKGDWQINGRAISDYFTKEGHINTCEEPLKLVDALGKFDIKVRVVGGGLSGQADAIRHAIAKALVLIDEDYRKIMKEAGFLTRDPRMVERKKYGRPKARKRFQFSKR